MNTEITTTGWFSRIGNSIKGIIVGILFFIAGIVFLFWNEGNFVKNKEALEEVAEGCVSLPSADSIDATNEGKVVHLTGTAKTNDCLRDALFNIERTAISLTRKVEYYQYVEDSHSETKKNLGGSETTTTTYSYSAKWVDEPIISDNFHNKQYKNTVFYKPATNEQMHASNVNLGAFRLSSGQIADISGDVAVAGAELTVPQSLAGRASIDGNYLYIGKESPQTAHTPTQQNVHQPVTVISCGYVIADSLASTPLPVMACNQARYVQLGDGTLPPLTAEGININGTLHPITEDRTNDGVVIPQQSLYAKLQRGESYPVLEFNKYKYVQLTDKKFVPIIDLNGTSVVVIDGLVSMLTLNNSAVLRGSAMPASSTVNPAAPVIGDVRISWFYIAPEQSISIIAQQTGSTFTPYVSKENGKKVSLLSMGIKNKEEMLSDAHSANSFTTWILRFVGWFVIFLGLCMILKPLSVLADVVPFIGSLVATGTTILAFIISAMVALATIAIAWLFYRPLISVPLAFVIVGLIVWLIMRNKKAKTAQS